MVGNVNQGLSLEVECKMRRYQVPSLQFLGFCLGLDITMQVLARGHIALGGRASCRQGIAQHLLPQITQECIGNC